MNHQPHDRPDDRPSDHPGDRATDLDVVEDIGGTDADRAFDAELSRLLRASAASSRGAASVHDLAAVKEGGLLRRRRRSRVQRTAAVAAAAAVVVVVAATGVVLHERTTASPRPAAGASLPLMADLPALSAEDEQRLQSLQTPPPQLTRGENSSYWNGSFDRWAVPVDCAEAAAWAGLPVPSLSGLDTRRYTQVCATDDRQALTDGSFTRSASGTFPSLYRFYLPPGTDLGQVSPGTAAAAGVSWIRFVPVAEQPPTVPLDSPADLAAGITTVTRAGGDLATVAAQTRGGTAISWHERLGDASFSADASIAADPVTAVRATLDPHPCDGGFNLTPVGSFGGALTARGALRTWLKGDDAADYPVEVRSQGAPQGGWVVVEDHDDDVTFASGDWRVTTNGHFPGTWIVTGKSCDVPWVPASSS